MGFVTKEKSAFPFWLQEVIHLRPRNLDAPSTDVVVTVAAYVPGSRKLSDSAPCFYYRFRPNICC